MNDLRKKLEISKDTLKIVNDFLLNENNPLINDLFTVVDKYGGVDEINKTAREARNIDNLIEKTRMINPNYVGDLKWLMKAQDNHSFISVTDYRKKILGEQAHEIEFNGNKYVIIPQSAILMLIRDLM